MPLRLTVTAGPNIGAQVTVVSGTPIIIGRDPRLAQFIIPSPCISRRHCRVSVVDTQPMIEDLESSAGIFLNGERVTYAPIYPGDRIASATVTIVVG